ncbi:hypothetical protein HD_0559 [[Haemophilus] ducreyi 35000HP]|uniref:Uncharacterized protein n=1 Tax=Haemophilus ducreyi (strain 35000HP / ATCC 700724) TaxID=233412 RepID=Q7VNH4_HAEDU|nr:hypothetical protein HD_0559 [[Haemophilus] ducreyi 35000HP]
MDGNKIANWWIKAQFSGAFWQKVYTATVCLMV